MGTALRSLVVVVLLSTLAWAAQPTTVTAELLSPAADVFVSGQDGYHTYRIPSLLVTPKGTLLAFAEGRKSSSSDAGRIDLVLKRSTDKGRTWSALQVVASDPPNTIGNPCPVVDRDTGTIWLLLTHNLGQDTERDLNAGRSKGTRTILLSSSNDDGVRWSKPVDITASTKLPEWTWYATGPGVGIQLRSGRLLIPCDHRVRGAASSRSHVIFSDDHGKTWKLGGVVGTDVNECQAVELADGSVLINMRSYRPNQRCRAVSISKDGGQSWSAIADDLILIEPICQASLVRFAGDATRKPCLLFCNPASQRQRERMTLRFSYDEGQTWPVSKLIYEGFSAYSCLVILPDVTAGCLYERDNYERITFARVAMEVGSSDAADFFVSPKGNDTWSGKLADPGENDGPFATVARARDAVRAVLRAQKQAKPIRVVLRGGTYYLDAPLEFGPEDSGTEQAPVVYAAATGEKVVLSGGRRLEKGQWGEVNGRKAWAVDLAEVRAGTWRFRQLFVNGQRRPRTRLPERGEYRIESLPGYTGDFLRSPTQQFVYAPGDILPSWHNLRDVEIVGITRWLDNRLPIESVAAQTRTVTFDRPSLFALHSGSKPGPYWVENVFEALDTPGQWYLDRPRGVLYYLPKPGEEMPVTEIVAPRLPQVVRVVGRADATVHDLRFEGITFSHTEWQPPADYASSLQAGIEVPGALLFDYAERCAVTHGVIEHIGNYGIEVGVGCSDIELSRNQITDIGAGGIRIGHFFSWETDGSGRLTERGIQRKAGMPQGPHSQRITVADNEIAHCGRFTPEAVGVFVGDNANNKIIHNHIHDLFYSGISVGSVQDFGPNHAQDNVVEYNHIHDIGQAMLSDLAGIYTCSTPGTRIRYNRVHDVSRRDYGAWGIYADEGSHDLLIQKNLVYRCQDGALFAHHNRNITAENNILALNPGAQVERGGIGGFELTCRRNLIYYAAGQAMGDYGSARCGRDVCVFDRNLYWNVSGQPILFGKRNLGEWRALGQDTQSLIADPLFVDAKNSDFRLRPGSPAGKIGFESWDLSAIGPRRDAAAQNATDISR